MNNSLTKNHIQNFNVSRELFEDKGFDAVKSMLHAGMLDILNIEYNDIILNDYFKIIEIKLKNPEFSKTKIID